MEEMIKNINIENYKSIVSLDMDLGKFNLMIGANGCGKSNILEAIGLASASSVNKLDKVYFASRGIRAVEPELMFPAFVDQDSKLIKISAKTDNDELKFNISYDFKRRGWDCFSDNLSDYPDKESRERFLNEVKQFLDNDFDNIMNLTKSKIIGIKASKGDISLKYQYPDSSLSDFVIYSLEESQLRQFDNHNDKHSLGRNGEGLFAHLKYLLLEKENGPQILEEIKDNLSVFDWFDDMEVPQDQLSNEFRVMLKDSYLKENLNSLDQRSTNEGFLYMLFYLTLIISDETPRFFAIDNIDASFNPKLCREATRKIIELAKKYNKQIIATTHNQSVLDGMDLTDGNQKLMSIYRDIDGYTSLRSITPKASLDIPLSEAWIKGYIGGLPNNF